MNEENRNVEVQSVYPGGQRFISYVATEKRIKSVYHLLPLFVSTYHYKLEFF